MITGMGTGPAGQDCMQKVGEPGRPLDPAICRRTPAGTKRQLPGAVSPGAKREPDGPSVESWIVVIGFAGPARSPRSGGRADPSGSSASDGRHGGFAEPRCHRTLHRLGRR